MNKAELLEWFDELIEHEKTVPIDPEWQDKVKGFCEGFIKGLQVARGAIDELLHKAGENE